MAVYIVQGKLGAGKGKYTIGKVRDALEDRRIVATNCDLWLENLLPQHSKQTALRLPDKPMAADLLNIGFGSLDSEKYKPERNGVLALDELGTWLNTRSYQDKDRSKFLDFLIHSRKRRWDVYLQVQNLDIVDKQVRVAVAEYLVKCINAEKIKIPVVGQMLGKRGTLPKFHIAVTTMADVPGVKIDTEFFKNNDIQTGYDTLQEFRDWVRDPRDEAFHEELYAGPYSYLSPWHLKGRFAPPVEAKNRSLSLFAAPQRVRPALKPKHPLIQAVSRLAPDQAWHFARLLNKQGAITCPG